MPFSFLYKLLFAFIQIVTGIELPCETKIGRRFKIEHFGGIIVSGDAVFGDDVLIRNGVTVGLRTTGRRGSPFIGNRVDIGAGAKLLGGITVGDDAVIGANAVVIKDVPRTPWRSESRPGFCRDAESSKSSDRKNRREGLAADEIFSKVVSHR